MRKENFVCVQVGHRKLLFFKVTVCEWDFMHRYTIDNGQWSFFAHGIFANVTAPYGNRLHSHY